MKYIRCGTMIDATGAGPVTGKVIAIDGERIKAIVDSADLRPAPEDEVIDLTGYTVMPGMIDSHDHLLLDMGDEAAQSDHPDSWLTIVSVVNAKKLLDAGITTLRDVGEKNFIDVDMKRAINSGLIQGPRMVISGQPIIRTGGHAHFLGRETDGVADMRKAVREQVKKGVDWIKIMVSGGMSTRGSQPDSQEFSTEEIQACIDEAHRAGRPVVAHIHGGTGAKVAIEAGVDSIEHGILLSEADVKLMAKHGTWLVSTAGLVDVAGSDPAVPAFYKAKMEQAKARSLEVRKWAKQYGVKVAVGNDTNHCRMDLEMAALLEGGWSPMEALRALTLRGAELCGLAEDLGTLQPGKVADVIALEGNPLSDRSALLRVKFVMKAGNVESPA